MKVEPAPHAKAHTAYRTADGVRVPSVTTVLRIMDKPFLLQWANRLGLEGYEVGPYTAAQAQVGTLAHALICAELRGEPLPNLTGFTPEEDARAENVLRSFRAWRRVHDVQPIQVEEGYVSETYRYGGTIDLYAIIDGLYTVGDNKTSGDIYFEQKVQVCTYGGLLRENAQRVDRVGIFRFPRSADEEFSEWYTDNIDSRYELFLKALDLYRIRARIEEDEEGHVKPERKAKARPSVRISLGRPQQPVLVEGSDPGQAGGQEKMNVGEASA